MVKIPKVILLVDNDRGAGREVLDGIAEYARLHGPWTFHIAPPYYIPNGMDAKQRIEQLNQWQPDGIITLDVEPIEKLVEINVPMIISKVTEKKQFDYPYMDSDNDQIGKIAAEYFLHRGYRNFAFCGFSGLVWSQERKIAFEKYIRKAGYDTNIYLDPPMQEQQWSNAPKELTKWLKNLPKPVSIMCCNDDRARHVLDACKSVEISVPEEVSVLGVDNDPLMCSLSFCQLSSISMTFKQAGYQAAQNLDLLMKDQPAETEKITIEPQSIITRQSTDITAISDLSVADAISFIRQNVKDPLQVHDVVEAVGIPRRSLYERFKKALGRSVHDEIKRVRTEEIRKLLLETDLSILRIAILLNFPNEKHIARYFAKEYGLSPREYRKKYRYQ